MLFILSIVVAFSALLLVLNRLKLFHPRDLEMLLLLLRVKWIGRRIIKKRRTLGTLLEKRAADTPDALAILFEDQQLTWNQLNQQANRIAHWSLAQNLKPRDTVCLMMENRPEFISTYFGLNKVGVCVSLINFNLKGKSLSHCVETSEARVVIVGEECVSALQTALPLPPNVRVFVYGRSAAIPPSMACLDDELPARTDNPPASVRGDLHANDVALLIFTSGTTGLPKAARIKHVRYAIAGSTFAIASHLTAADRVYTCLPLYHSAGSMIGTGMCLYTGACQVLRRKFSASNFFKDCVQYDVTVVQYIGQICRYLVTTPPLPYDTRHRIRLAIGNGFRADVWKNFVDRFQIPQVLEFYAATEGNANLYNSFGRIGAVGYIPAMAFLFYPLRLVKFDIETESPIRDAAGRCVDAATDEPGELIGAIVEGDPLREFARYTSDQASAKKVLTDVFRKGDRWFRTGDLLRRDADGFLFFVDRIGDTFRWKGENVATSEVALAVCSFPGINEANVYGVEVPGYDGRAGMAALPVGKPDAQDDDAHMKENEFEWKEPPPALYAHLTSQLPGYAIPLFIRLQQENDLTGTFKLKKSDLVREGFNPDSVKGDALFVRDDARKTYVPLTREMYRDICAKTIRF